MSAHVQIFYEGEWHMWCQVDQRVELGDTREQVELVRNAYDHHGISLICGHENSDEAQRMVDFMREHRPHIQLRVVDGPCQRIDWRDDWRDEYPHENP